MYSTQKLIEEMRQKLSVDQIISNLSPAMNCYYMKELQEQYGEKFRIIKEEEGLCQLRVDLIRKYTVLIRGPPLQRHFRHKDIAIREGANTMVYTIYSLPPIFMNFSLTKNYLSLESSWLPQGLMNSLTKILPEIKTDSHDIDSLNACYEYLEKGALQNLFRSTTPFLIEIDTKKCIFFPKEELKFLRTVLDFEESIRDKEIEKERPECPICFERLPAFKCIRLGDCNHIFCKECLAKSIAADVRRGANAGSPTCPCCRVEIHPLEIRQVCSSELYEKYEKMLLNRTLASMPDVVECPSRKCKNPHVLLKNDFSEGVCAICSFHFCAKCRLKVHPGRPCAKEYFLSLTDEEKIKLWERYDEASADEMSWLENEYGKNELIRLRQEVASKKFVEEKCKCCPACGVPIQKVSGCNNMICTHCRQKFCWRCLRKRGNYDSCSC